MSALASRLRALRLRLRRRAVIQQQTIRLASGLVLFSFALGHFLNHALGIVSVEAMEEMQTVRIAIWRSPEGTVLLYGALAVHVGFGLAKILTRRTFRMSWWEGAQIALGLSIPILGANHVATTRGIAMATGFEDTYTAKLRMLWPDAAVWQSAFLIVVWLHAVIGLHHWLRTKRWYGSAAPYLLGLAVLVPTLALVGWIEAGRAVAERQFAGPVMNERMQAMSDNLVLAFRTSVWTVLGVALLAWLALKVAQWFRTGPAVTYAGDRTVRAPSGATLLEISRAAGIPHAAVCGGRGRCSTCRVAVLYGLEGLPPPNPTEAAALTRLGAPPSIRLACQIRPAHDVTVRPLVPLKEAGPTVSRDAYRWGVERRITVMFADLRGFTTLAEHLYPYDAVFLLNRYFEVMAAAIERNGGEVDKFLGDGIMALFGLGSGSGAAESIRAAADMLGALDALNREFEATLSDRLRMGIGLHLGPVVLGRVGGGRQEGLTALGDTVNIASRLEGLNKEFGSCVVLSEAVLKASRLDIAGEWHDVPLRGRGEGLRVAVVRERAGLQDAPLSAANALPQ